MKKFSWNANFLIGAKIFLRMVLLLWNEKAPRRKKFSCKLPPTYDSSKIEILNE